MFLHQNTHHHSHTHQKCSNHQHQPSSKTNTLKRGSGNHTTGTLTRGKGNGCSSGGGSGGNGITTGSNISTGNNSCGNESDIMTSANMNVPISSTIIHPPQPPIRTSSNPDSTNNGSGSGSGGGGSCGVIGSTCNTGTTSTIIHSSLNQNANNTSTLKKRVQIQEVTV